MKAILVGRLDSANVRPYGFAIRAQGAPPAQGDFTWYGEMARMENQATQFNLCAMRAHAFTLSRMEVHRGSREALVVLHGEGVVLAMAPRGAFDPQAVEAFYLAAGEGIVFEAGTYHSTPYPLAGTAKLLIAFEADTGINDNVQVDLEQEVWLDTRFLQV